MGYLHLGEMLVAKYPCPPLPLTLTLPSGGGKSVFRKIWSNLRSSLVVSRLTCRYHPRESMPFAEDRVQILGPSSEHAASMQ